MNGINCGVPQGPILGPLLFFIHIDDLCSMCWYTTPILFADDTNLFWSGSDIKTIESNIDTELTQIALWLNMNKLSLNIKRIHYWALAFSKKRTQRSESRLQIDGETIYMRSIKLTSSGPSLTIKLTGRIIFPTYVERYQGKWRDYYYSELFE